MTMQEVKASQDDEENKANTGWGGLEKQAVNQEVMKQTDDQAKKPQTKTGGEIVFKKGRGIKAKYVRCNILLIG